MKKELTPYGVGSFFISSATFLSQVVSNEVRECTWLGYRPPRPVGETGGRYHLGESEAQRLIFQIAPTNVQHCTYAWESRMLLNSEASACNLGITFFARLIAVGDDFIP